MATGDLRRNLMTEQALSQDFQAIAKQTEKEREREREIKIVIQSCYFQGI
jgi:hypothetical protein